MKYILILFGICSFLITSLKAQVNWVGNFSINKIEFPENNDSIKISIEIYSEGITDSETENNSLNSTVSFYSGWTNSEPGLIRDEYKFSMLFEKRIENRHRYFVRIPAASLKNNSYSVKISISINNTNSDREFPGKDNPQIRIVVGTSGIMSISSGITINDTENEYTFQDIDSTSLFIPQYLEGIYTKGFCIDEYISVNNFNLLIWNYNSNQLNLKALYSIDDDEFQQTGIYSIIDDSNDGSVNFNGKIFDFSEEQYNILYSSVKFEIKLEDLLKKLAEKNKENHTLRFYFSYEQDGKLFRFPEDRDLTIKFKVVNTPTGPECQAALLPIDLIYWDALLQEKTVFLKWGTAAEINNDYFEIERSFDAKSWKSIKKIKGKGNANDQSHYTSIDEFPMSGVNYYRLKQTDYDGSHKYSKLKPINNIDNELILYPNPARDFLFYKIIDVSKKFIIEIVDLNGRIVETHIVPDELSTNLYLDISHLEKGMYLLKYKNTQNKQVKVERLIKM